jgi:16S rRNA (uracil1498-N3)-methyltransferase
MTTGRDASARLYVEHDLGERRSVGLTAAQAHYLKHVLRLSAGARVALFNGRDGEWMSRIDTIRRGWGSLEVGERLRDQIDEPDLWLLFAPIKRARLDFLVQKAVELGVSRISPVYTDHTEVKRLNSERHRFNVIEAAEQCERLTLPEFTEPCPLAAALDEFPSNRQMLVCAERGDGMPLEELLHEPEARGTSYAFLCGPEGGFSQTELDGFDKLSFIRLVSLGPRILRAETAALSAVACWQATLGDWRRRSPI